MDQLQVPDWLVNLVGRLVLENEFRGHVLRQLQEQQAMRALVDQAQEVK